MFRTAAFIIVMAATTISGFASPIDPSDAKVVVGPIAPASVEAGPVAAVVSESAVSTPQLSEGEQALVDWARGRFEEAGLSLPEIEVRFDPTRELCHNNDGLYRGDADGPHVVTICTRDSDTFAAQLERRRTLLHEFGHVWDTVNLTDEDGLYRGDADGPHVVTICTRCDRSRSDSASWSVLARRGGFRGRPGPLR